MPKITEEFKKGLCNKCKINPRASLNGKKYARAWCNPCLSEHVRQWRKTPKGFLSARNTKIKIAHGNEAVEIYNRLLTDQKNRCAICNRTPQEAHKSAYRTILFVDHDHNSGKIRGLLCNQCNSALGKLQDSPDICRKAAEYLERL